MACRQSRYRPRTASASRMKDRPGGSAGTRTGCCSEPAEVWAWTSRVRQTSGQVSSLFRCSACAEITLPSDTTWYTRLASEAFCLRSNTPAFDTRTSSFLRCVRIDSSRSRARGSAPIARPSSRSADPMLACGPLRCLFADHRVPDSGHQLSDTTSLRSVMSATSRFQCRFRFPAP
jgi:hypothetical protein